MARPGRHRRQYRVREATPPRYASAAPATALTGVLLDSDVIIDAATGRRVATYLARYAGSHGLEIADALIAAAASTAGLHLWTRNTRHYPMDGLRLHRPVPVTS